MSEKPALRVEKRLAETALKLLADVGLLDKGFKIKRLNRFVVIPLIRKPMDEELRKLSRLNPVICMDRFKPRVRVGSLREVLKGRIPDELLSLTPSSLDLIGEVAIIQPRDELKPYLKIIGGALMEIYPRVKTVLAKVEPIHGDFRVGRYEVVAGSGETETVYREHRCTFLLDPVKVYFSPRLSYERFRVASMVKPGEVILDMFAGVGCYSILIAKTVKDCLVYAVDLNPEAFKYLKRNIEVNKVQDRVIPVKGNVTDIVKKRLNAMFNRVIMDHPSKARLFLETACESLKPSGGSIHYYGFYQEPNPESKALREFQEGVEATGRRVEWAKAKIVREIAPRSYHVAVDGMVQ